MPRLEAWLGHGNSSGRKGVKRRVTRIAGRCLERVPKAHRIINGMNADGYQPGRGSGAAESGGAALGSVRHWGRALAAALRRAVLGPSVGGRSATRRWGRPAGRALAAARRWGPGTSAGGWPLAAARASDVHRIEESCWSVGVLET
jgi:hypothetical protein